MPCWRCMKGGWWGGKCSCRDCFHRSFAPLIKFRKRRYRQLQSGYVSAEMTQSPSHCGPSQWGHCGSNRIMRGRWKPCAIASCRFATASCVSCQLLIWPLDISTRNRNARPTPPWSKGPLVPEITKRYRNDHRHGKHKRNREVRNLEIDDPAVNQPADAKPERSHAHQRSEGIQQPRGRALAPGFFRGFVLRCGIHLRGDSRSGWTGRSMALILLPRPLRFLATTATGQPAPSRI
jgi:hypothetical protein